MEVTCRERVGYLVPNDQLSPHGRIEPAALDEPGAATAKETSMIARRYLFSADKRDLQRLKGLLSLRDAALSTYLSLLERSLCNIETTGDLSSVEAKYFGNEIRRKWRSLSYVTANHSIMLQRGL